VVSDFWSLLGDIVFRSLFGAPVSGGKNAVPNSIGQISGGPEDIFRAAFVMKVRPPL